MKIVSLLPAATEIVSALGLRDALVGRSHECDHPARLPFESRPRVAVIEWLAPVMLAGHWVPEAVEAAGGASVGPLAGVASPYASFEEIRALRPHAIVVAPGGFDLERTVAEATPLADVLRNLAPRVLPMDGNAYLNRPGPRVVDAVETMAVWLRGEAAVDCLVRPPGPPADTLAPSLAAK